MKQITTALALVFVWAQVGAARADDAAPQPPPSEPAPGAEKAPQKPLLGLSVATPDTGSLPGRFRPSYGVAPVSANDYRFDFHGYMVVPLRMGMNHRAHPSTLQYSTVYHAPPVT